MFDTQLKLKWLHDDFVPAGGGAPVGAKVVAHMRLPILTSQLLEEAMAMTDDMELWSERAVMSTTLARSPCKEIYTIFLARLQPFPTQRRDLPEAPTTDYVNRLFLNLSIKSF